MERNSHSMALMGSGNEYHIIVIVYNHRFYETVVIILVILANYLQHIIVYTQL